MERKTMLALVLISVLSVGTAEGLEITRHMPSEVPFNSTFEVTLKINGSLPIVVGINETIPDGFSFVNASCPYKVSGQKVAFAAINVTEIKYWVRAPPASGVKGTFTGHWVDMLNEGEGGIADTTVSVVPREIVDSAGRTVIINKTIERIVVLHTGPAKALKILGCEDKVVGICAYTKKMSFYFPKMSKKMVVAAKMAREVDWEAIMNLTPDLVITFTKWGGGPSIAEEKLGPGIAVVALDLYKPEKIPEELKKLAYLLEREDRASKFIEWYNREILTIKELVKGKEKPKVLVISDLAKGKTDEITVWGPGSSVDKLIDLAGGVNIYHDAKVSYPKVSSEDIIRRNPDIIIIEDFSHIKYDSEDEAQKLIKDVLKGKNWDNVDAVKNGKVYTVPVSLSGMGTPVIAALFAKIFHPEINDINPNDPNVNSPEDVLEEFLDFMGIKPEGKIFWYPQTATTAATTTPKATPTATLTSKATPAATPQTQTKEVTKAITTPKPTPGFESAFAVIAVLASLLLLRRKW